jgi:spermidine synthase
MLLISLAALSVSCFLCGALFPAASRLFGEQAAGRAYLWEAVGSAAGGLVAGLVLIRFLSPVEAAWGLGLLNGLAACGWAARLRWRGRFLLAAVPALLVLCALPKWGALSRPRVWTRNSVYGSLAVVESEGARSLYENGLRLFTVPDPEAAEEAVHYALLEHPSPRSALLIGGGVNGSAAQALQHGLARLDYVELDPAVLDIAREFFPREWAALQADPRVRVHVADGRLFVKTTTARFDVIVVNLPDPQTALLNRFYTAEFFEEAARRLSDTGVLAFSLTGSENYIPANLAELLRCMNQTARSVFPEVTAMPGEMVHFFATKRAGVLASGPAELLARLRSRHLETSYVSEYFIPFRMAPDRVRELERQIRPLDDTPVNRDSRPVAYAFSLAVWSSQFHAAYRTAFGVVAAIVGALVLLAAAGCRRSLRASAAFCTVSTGFVTIGLEILALLGFQAAYGYVYSYLALLIAAFMVGLAAGSYLGLRHQARTPGLALAVVQMVAVLVSIGAGIAAGMAWSPGLAFLAGCLGGFQFCLAARIFHAGAGTLYALDVAGSCLGALLFSVYLVPVFGFFRTGLLLALVSLAAALTALSSSLRRPAR